MASRVAVGVYAYCAVSSHVIAACLADDQMDGGLALEGWQEEILLFYLLFQPHAICAQCVVLCIRNGRDWTARHDCPDLTLCLNCTPNMSLIKHTGRKGHIGLHGRSLVVKGRLEVNGG